MAQDYVPPWHRGSSVTWWESGCVDSGWVVYGSHGRFLHTCPLHQPPLRPQVSMPWLRKLPSPLVLYLSDGCSFFLFPKMAPLLFLALLVGSSQSFVSSHSFLPSACSHLLLPRSLPSTSTCVLSFRYIHVSNPVVFNHGCTEELPKLFSQNTSAWAAHSSTWVRVSEVGPGGL